MKSHISILMPEGNDSKEVYFDYNGIHFKTNKSGYGLWIYRTLSGEYSQVLGTCQFHLTQKHRASMRNYIKTHIIIDNYGHIEYRSDGGCIK